MMKIIVASKTSVIKSIMVSQLCFIFSQISTTFNSTQIWQLKNRLKRARDVLNTPFVWQYQHNYEVAILESGHFNPNLYHSIHWFWRRNFQKTSIINKLEAMVAILVVRQDQHTNLEEDHLSSVTTSDADQGMAKLFWAFGYGKLKMYMASCYLLFCWGNIVFGKETFNPNLTSMLSIKN